MTSRQLCRTCAHCGRAISYAWGGKGSICGMCGSRVHFEKGCDPCPRSPFYRKGEQEGEPQLSLGL